jgi:hypothetical protein
MSRNCVDCGAEHKRRSDVCKLCRRERDLTARALRQRAAYQPKRQLDDRCAKCRRSVEQCPKCWHRVGNRLNMRAVRAAQRADLEAQGVVIRSQGRPRKDGTETKRQVA